MWEKQKVIERKKRGGERGRKIVNKLGMFVLGHIHSGICSFFRLCYYIISITMKNEGKRLVVIIKTA